MSNLPSMPSFAASDIASLSPGERLERETQVFQGTIGSEVMLMSGRLPRPDNCNAHIDGLERAIAEVEAVEAFLASGAFQDFRRRLLDWAQPAVGRDFGEAVTVLICAFPNRPNGAQIYTTALCEDLAVLAPTRLGLNIGTRRLRRTSRFVPVIAEVLGAVAAADQNVRLVAERAAALPGRVSEARALIENRRLALATRTNIHPLAPPSCPESEEGSCLW